ncbi:cathepsin l [Plakobranchus ocellatus]|uniref:Cathepsin l n=1 Tax=Plakobranchus ocellatus TaxID=259542 RepID=A0AAV4E2H4_9GAST|nr:cathepsin l [Plakobranchus ocellatus]
MKKKRKIGALEASWFAFTGRLISLSKQQLIDCVEQADGCHGGHVIRAYQHISKAGGVDIDANYPYRATAAIAAENVLLSILSKAHHSPVCFLLSASPFAAGVSHHVDFATVYLSSQEGKWGSFNFLGSFSAALSLTSQSMLLFISMCRLLVTSKADIAAEVGIPIISTSPDHRDA